MAGAVWPTATGLSLKDRAGQDETATGDRGELTGDLAGLSLMARIEAHPGSFASGIHHSGHILLYTYGGMRDPTLSDSQALAEVIAAWRPRAVADQAARVAREMVAAAGPDNASRTKALLFACSKLATFAISVGLGTTKEVLFRPEVIERFVLVGTKDLAPATRRTLRTNLRHLARRVTPELAPGPVPLSRERAKAPYTHAQIASYLALAAAQPTLARRLRAGGLICLGAGAGMIGQDLRAVRGTDVVRRSGGLVVEVDGRRPRVVPVLVPYHELLCASATFAGEGYLIGASDPERRNVTTPLVSSLSGGLHLPRLQTSRLRSSWLRDVAEQIGLAAFMAAAGVSCSQRLGDIVASLDPPSEEEAVRVLGGVR